MTEKKAEVKAHEEACEEAHHRDDAAKAVAGVSAGETEIQEPAGERLKRLERELEAKEAEASENHDKFLRARADLENSKKRWEKEKAEYINFAIEGLVMEILPVIDNLERALEHTDAGEANLKSLADGVKLTIDQMQKVLNKFGVREIKAVGEKFDPVLHHAISHEETADAPSDTVIKEFQKGYLLRDRLLRPSMVSVARGPEAVDEEEKEG